MENSSQNRSAGRQRIGTAWSTVSTRRLEQVRLVTLTLFVGSPVKAVRDPPVQNEKRLKFYDVLEWLVLFFPFAMFL